MNPLRQKPIAHLSEREKALLIYDHDYIDVDMVIERGRQALENAEATFASVTRQPQIAAKPETTSPKTATINAILRLLDECGWTPYRLAKVTRIDKKQVLGHIKKGKGISLGNRKKYEDAFTKELGRPVKLP